MSKSAFLLYTDRGAVRLRAELELVAFFAGMHEIVPCWHSLTCFDGSAGCATAKIRTFFIYLRPPARAFEYCLCRYFCRTDVILSTLHYSRLPKICIICPGAVPLFTFG